MPLKHQLPPAIKQKKKTKPDTAIRATFNMLIKLFFV